MDAETEDAGTQAQIEWDGGSGGANAVMGLAGGGAAVSLCYHQAYGPHDDLLTDLLQGR
jgi:sister chromatid cohesion protein DCC1